MNKVAAFALRRKNSILSMSEKVFCPPQPLRFWITPACAGKRASCSILSCSHRDHPRVCGEKERWPAIRTASLGSPPRVRGKVKNATGIDAFSGITPACAGKRFVWFGLTPDGQDHPRVCGEKSKTLRGLMHFLGSPPRVRGKDILGSPLVRGERITPACAGKSNVRLAVDGFSEDHPRVCGEKAQ